MNYHSKTEPSGKDYLKMVFNKILVKYGLKIKISISESLRTGRCVEKEFITFRSLFIILIFYLVIRLMVFRRILIRPMCGLKLKRLFEISRF